MANFTNIALRNTINQYSSLTNTMTNKKLLSLMTVMLAATATYAQTTDSLNYT